MRIARDLVILAIRSYKYVISPWLPAACRFTPSCSEFALEALQRNGLFRGGVLAVGRVFRCHPFNRGGFDPVT